MMVMVVGSPEEEEEGMVVVGWFDGFLSGILLLMLRVER
jgi:hypothetical protein